VLNRLFLYDFTFNRLLRLQQLKIFIFIILFLKRTAFFPVFYCFCFQQRCHKIANCNSLAGLGLFPLFPRLFRISTPPFPHSRCLADISVMLRIVDKVTRNCGKFYLNFQCICCRFSRNPNPSNQLLVAVGKR